MSKNAEKIINKLIKNGYEAYLIGGCVRDMLMENDPLDYDITTSATPDIVTNLFERTVPTGLKHGTVTVIIEKKSYEVTTFRTEGIYEDQRHPKEVVFTKSLKEDVKRRDFTINSIAYNNREGFIDYYGGKEDIKNKIIKTVGNPSERFSEDPLRILRGIRFAARFGFCIDEATYTSMKELMPLVKNISKERIFDELSKMFSKNPKEAVILLCDTGFFDIFFAIPAKENIELIDKLKVKNFVTVFSLLYYNNLQYKEYLKLLKCSNKIKSDVDKICCCTDTKLYTKQDIKMMLKNHCFEDLIDEIFDIKILLKTADNSVYRMYEEIKINQECYQLSSLAINGKDLIKLGLKNDEIKKTLDCLLNLVITDNSLNEKKNLTEILLTEKEREMHIKKQRKT